VSGLYQAMAFVRDGQAMQRPGPFPQPVYGGRLRPDMIENDFCSALFAI
jgi:hypothetical protein